MVYFVEVLTPSVLILGVESNLDHIVGVNETTVHVVTTLGSDNFLWRDIGKVNCSYGGTAPNVSGIHER
ncbi:hypothetical protein FQA39_LY01850 [Lamprigera yunnana]|nr:hypothetical protein FQA39_LY01850 [Lamprigera yunnana]